jgi:hypothetical protein
MISAVSAWFQTRDWQVYPLLPPLVSLFFSFYVVSIERLLNDRLKKKLESAGLQSAEELIIAIVSDRVLQAGYLSSVLSFIATLLIISEFIAEAVFAIVLLVVFVVLLFSTLVVFLSDPGDLFATLLKRPRTRWVTHRADRYTVILIGINIAMVGLAILGLPRRCP